MSALTTALRKPGPLPGFVATIGFSLFWLSLTASLVIAFAATFPVNRWLIARGRGHAVVHELHAH